jgi:hypothetical protein
MLPSWKKFQHLNVFALASCCGKSTMKPFASASASQRVSSRNWSAVCVHQCKATTSGRGVPAWYVDGMYSS